MGLKEERGRGKGDKYNEKLLSDWAWMGQVRREILIWFESIIWLCF